MTTLDPTLHRKIQQAVHNALMAMIRPICGVGLNPRSAVALIREQLDNIETTIKEEIREAIADVRIPSVGDQRTEAEAPVVGTATSDRQLAELRRKRGGEPSKPWPRGDGARPTEDNRHDPSDPF